MRPYESSWTLIEGNGNWTQGQLRKDEDYLRGVRKAQKLLQNLAWSHGESAAK